MDLEIKGMNFGYNPENLILHDIDLRIDRPGLYCIIGPNGVGKSTLVKCITKLLVPQSGSMEINGIDIPGASYKDLAKIIGYIPVKPDESFSKTVFETVMLGRYPHQKWGVATDDDYRIVAETIQNVGIEHLAMRETCDLSAGQFQRVTIARGIAQVPDLLILDEPTANLDARYQIMMTRLLKERAYEDGMAVLMISHDLNIAARFADQVILMGRPGKILDIGTPGDVITRDNIRRAYSVDCDIIQVGDHPHVILLDELDEEVEERSENIFGGSDRQHTVLKSGLSSVRPISLQSRVVILTGPHLSRTRSLGLTCDV